MSISKKGQGISINVIIIAAIALLVLIILAVLVARSSTDFSEGTKCIKKGGTCKDAFCPGYEIKSIDGTTLCGDGKSCCSPIPRE